MLRSSLSLGVPGWEESTTAAEHAISVTQWAMCKAGLTDVNLITHDEWRASSEHPLLTPHNSPRAPDERARRPRHDARRPRKHDSHKHVCACRMRESRVSEIYTGDNTNT